LEAIVNCLLRVGLMLGVAASVVVTTATVPIAAAAATITFRAASGTDGGGRTLTVARPAGTQQDDVLVAAVYWDNSAPNTITPPSGFTLIRQDAGATTQAVSLYYHVASGTEPATYTWLATRSSGFTGIVAAYSNVDIANPIDAHGGQTGSGTSATAPSITTSTADDVLVGVWSSWNSNLSLTPPGGMTTRQSYSRSDPLTFAERAAPAAGATGTSTATASANPNTWTAQVLALRPRSGPNPGPQADLSISQSTNVSQVYPGGTVSFDIPVVNNGPSAATSVVIDGNVPANTTSISLGRADGWTCTGAPPQGTGSFRCTNPSVAPGQTGGVSLFVRINPETLAGTDITNSVTISSATPDPNLANNSSTLRLPIPTAAPADLAVSLTTGSSTVIANQITTYTMVVTNNGPSAIANPSLKDPVPANMTDQSRVTQPGWSCGVSGPPGFVALQCTTSTLAAGATASFTWNVIVNPGTPVGTVISNTASVFSLADDPNQANNSSTANVTVVAPGPAAIAFRSVASTEIWGRTLTITRPAGVQPNDVLVAAVYSDNSAPNTITPPSGFTLIRQDAGASTQALSLYYHVVSVSEPASYVWSASRSSGFAGILAAYSGVDPTNPIDAHAGLTDVQRQTFAPPLTTTTDGDWLLGVYSSWNSNLSFVLCTGQVGKTIRASLERSEPMMLADQPLATAGVTGTQCAFAWRDPGVTTAQSVALRKAP
jgi:uncharacterized repeat protein (TIGR01451 family)